MKSIERHQISRQFVIKENLEDLKTEVLPAIRIAMRQNPGHVFGASQSEVHAIFVNSVCAEQDHQETIEHLCFYERFVLTNFRIGAGKEPFSMEFNNEKLTFTPERKTAFMSVDNWEDAYDACMILRDMAGLKFLSSVPENVFAESNNGTTPHDLSYYRFLAHFFNGGKETGNLLINAFEEAMKPQSNSTRTKFVELVRIPILDLLHAFVEGDNRKFNDLLCDSLESHKKYFGTKENAYAKPGWLSMRILAACAMAVDAKGFSIEVESDYIPRWLYLGEGIK